MNPLFDVYGKSLAGVSTAVLGYGVSNIPLVDLLVNAGAAVTVRDKKAREALGPAAEELEARGVRLVCGAGYLEGLCEQRIYRTPGLRPDAPEILRAVENGSILTSEMEDFFSVCPCPIIGVTGSDGKTTTTTLIAEMLRAEGTRVHLGGNIGHPLLGEAWDMEPGDAAVLELSSFQLMTMKRSPSVAVLTNIAPNHLDIHKSMEEYVSAKENIFLHQGEASLTVLNADCALTRAMAGRVRGRARLFSRKEALAEGVSLEKGAVILREEGRREELFSMEDIFLPGAHNLENYMAACAAVYGCVKPETMARVARTFAGVPHRIEFVAEIGGVRYYNDSIASSPTRTRAGLHAFSRKVILIAGGYDKKIPFDTLGPAAAAHVKTLILIGATANAIRAVVEKTDGAPPVVDAGTLEKAVALAAGRAEPGDIVLMSPACASFDQFVNFEARGERFKELVRGLAEKG